MKNILYIALLLFGIVMNAQTELPEGATDIAPLLIGEKIPDVKLKSIDNEEVSLVQLLHKKRTILVFYRGGWCPYCNLHLAALGETESELLALGYQIIAVSPDAPKNLKVTEEKDKVKYLLLSDSKGELAQSVGIAFKAPKKYESVLAKGSEDINTAFMPVPSLFIVNLDGEIEFEFISPDYKHRISNNLLMAVAKALNEK